jgi:hypothetical protein
VFCFVQHRAGTDDVVRNTTENIEIYAPGETANGPLQALCLPRRRPAHRIATVIHAANDAEAIAQAEATQPVVAARRRPRERRATSRSKRRQPTATQHGGNGGSVSAPARPRSLQQRPTMPRATTSPHRGLSPRTLKRSKLYYSAFPSELRADGGKTGAYSSWGVASPRSTWRPSGCSGLP